MHHHDDLEAKKEPKAEHKGCGCGDEKCCCEEGKCNCCGCCCCGCKGAKFWIVLLEALVLFLSGYGFAHLGCCKHQGLFMQKPPHHAAMVKHHAHPDFADGANNIIIINSDGEVEVARRHHHKHKKMLHKHGGMYGGIAPEKLQQVPNVIPAEDKVQAEPAEAPAK